MQADAPYRLVGIYEYWSWDRWMDLAEAGDAGKSVDPRPSDCRVLLCGTFGNPPDEAVITAILAQVDNHLRLYDGCCFLRRAHSTLADPGAAWLSLAGRVGRRFIERDRVGRRPAPLVSILEDMQAALSIIKDARLIRGTPTAEPAVTPRACLAYMEADPAGRPLPGLSNHND